MSEPETGQLRGDAPAGESPIATYTNATCSLAEDFYQPVDSIYYFRDGDEKIVDIYDAVAPVDTQVVFECKDSKLKTAYRRCQSDGTWSTQSAAISCDKWRYWAAVIAAATSAVIVVVLFIYFTCSAYNKRKKRKYIARKERMREQDHVMMRNENFVRANFQSLPLSLHPDASAPEEEDSVAVPN
jgi:hypothetical protein